ncbi:MAG: hypothetical protein ACREEM_46475 [Blastocatellia bacterium]
MIKFKTKLSNIYERIATTGDYIRNLYNLKGIQIAVLTISAIATGFTNAFAHKDKIGTVAAFFLAILILSFVEKFFLTLRHGLNTVYAAGKQRFYAQVCYRAIQATIIANACIFAVWLGGIEMPAALLFWSKWSIVVHLSLALIGVSAVLDSDPVVANRILELKAQRAHRDIVTVRKSAAIGNRIVLLAASLRGHLEAFRLAGKILRSKSTFAADSLAQLDQLAAREFALLGTGDELGEAEEEARILAAAIQARTAAQPSKPRAVWQGGRRIDAGAPGVRANGIDHTQEMDVPKDSRR